MLYLTVYSTNAGAKLMSLMICLLVDTLFAAFEDGSIVKADSCTNPCTVQAEWKCSNIEGR